MNYLSLMPKRFLISTALLAASATSGYAFATHLQPEELATLTFEQLLNVRVVNVETDLRRLVGETSAIHVISREEILRSGFRTLPDLLRQVPGLHIGQISKTGFSVSARGFNGDFADKMEVLLDGRRLQTPLYLGVQWGLHDTFLSDIERIEVIRGPGGSLWGINAVNGVINIVTRSAEETHGSRAYIGGGNEQRAFAGARYGGETEGGKHYRIWAKSWRRDESNRDDGSKAPDGTFRHQAGFRTDWGDADSDVFNFQGDGFYRTLNDIDTVFESGTLGGRPDPVHDRFYGVNTLFRWSRKLDDKSNFSLKTSWDYLVRDTTLLGDRRNTFDLSLTHVIQLNPRHLITSGAGYQVSDDTVNDSFSLVVTPKEETLRIATLFIQDRVTMLPDFWFVTVGSKFEHNDFTGFEAQPSLRSAWVFSEQHTVWAALSRAVRTPSRLDTGVRFIVDQLAPDTFVAVLGNPQFQSETLVAHEVGYRFTPRADFSLDVAAFYNDYRKLRSFQPGTPFVADGAVFVPLDVTNANTAKTRGVEVGMRWAINPSVNLNAGYTWFDMDLDRAPGDQPTTINATEGADPEHQFFAHLGWQPNPRWTFDSTVRAVGELPALNVQSYTELDVRAAWAFKPDWQLALAGLNLIHDERVQYVGSTTFDVRNTVARQLTLELTWTPSK